MFFNSFQFLVFLPIVVALYFALPHRYRWPMLLLASYYFYACWRLEYLVLILASTGVDYVAALRMEKASAAARKRTYLILSLCSNLGILFAFKYFNFFNESIRATLDQFNVFYDVPAFDVLLPVGISFYTFQTLSYTIDVYRGQRPAEHHLGIFALYVAFFPQLVAGPIERSTRLLPQFFEKKSFNYDRAVDGLKLMLWGFFKKLVIADRLAVYVDAVYGSAGTYEGFPILLATYFFAFQIYCDFSGYSDIAIGAARIMGYELMDNFRQPYFSKSIGEFWRRWHISLSTWFRDYLYIPLGGNRVVKWRWYYNLFVVFVVSGLWHGANWTFVFWGALHGGYMIAGSMTVKSRDALWQRIENLAQRLFGGFSGWRAGVGHARNGIALLLTFHLVVFSWVFFRAESVATAFHLLGDMMQWNTLALTVKGFGYYELLIAILAIGTMEWIHLLERRKNFRDLLKARPAWLRWGVYYALTMSILLFGIIDQKQAFIYFQF